jgi:Subtilisin inhibitor-like
MKLVSLCALAVVLTACGNDAGDGGDAPPSTSLTITYRADDTAEPVVQTLTCDPSGGDVPDPPAACNSLIEADNPFAPTPPATACTEIYGGPQTATVTGTFRGEPVDASFERTNGCEIARWDSLAFLWPAGAEGSA